MSIKKIILTGGGTGGSVTPLLALSSDIKAKGWKLEWIGTYKGLEKDIVTKENIPFHAISSGKFRRYFSLQNIIDPFFILVGFFQSLSLLSRLQADLVMSAGGFVSVPVVFAAWILRIPVIIHQQDIKPGLANRIMSVFASAITVTFEKSLEDYKQKAVWIGNPIRQEFIKVLNSTIEPQSSLPRLLILGGGTGAEGLNELVYASLSELTQHFVVVHITGNKVSTETKVSDHNYQAHVFLQVGEMAEVMKQASIVVTRAGLGTLTELSFLSKPTIIIPMPNSHQEDNATYFQEKNAAVVLSQPSSTPQEFIDTIIKLKQDTNRLTQLGQTIHSVIKPGAEEAIIKLMHSTIEK